MDLLSTGLLCLTLLVAVHIAVFFVVRTLYPPKVAVPLTAPEPVAAPLPPVFTEPPIIQQQTVNVPTVEAPVQTESIGQERPAPNDFLSSGPSA